MQHTPVELLETLDGDQDVLTAITVYKEAAAIGRECETVKEKARALVKRHIEQTGETKGRTPAGTFGLTNPTPKYQVNEERWQEACRVDSRLAAIQTQFDAVQRVVDDAQREFLEEITPAPVLYIK